MRRRVGERERERERDREIRLTQKEAKFVIIVV
jgi:hypothetical protein